MWGTKSAPMEWTPELTRYFVGTSAIVDMHDYRESFSSSEGEETYPSATGTDIRLLLHVQLSFLKTPKDGVATASLHRATTFPSGLFPKCPLYVDIAVHHTGVREKLREAFLWAAMSRVPTLEMCFHFDATGRPVDPKAIPVETITITPVIRLSEPKR